jgi:hypothetical protein
MYFKRCLSQFWKIQHPSISSLLHIHFLRPFLECITQLYYLIISITISYIIVVAECSRHTLLLCELQVVCSYVNQLFDGGLAETVPDTMTDDPVRGQILTKVRGLK